MNEVSYELWRGDNFISACAIPSVIRDSLQECLSLYNDTADNYSIHKVVWFRVKAEIDLTDLPQDVSE